MQERYYSIKLIKDILIGIYNQCGTTTCVDCHINKCCDKHARCYEYLISRDSKDKCDPSLKDVVKFYRLQSTECKKCLLKSNNPYCIKIGKALLAYDNDLAAQHYVGKILALEYLEAVK